MGRTRNGVAPLDTEARLARRRAHYYRTRDEAISAQAYYHASQVAQILTTHTWTAEDLTKLTDYIKDNFKFKACQSAIGCSSGQS